MTCTDAIRNAREAANAPTLTHVDVPVRSGGDYNGRADALTVDLFESPEGAIVCIASSALTGETWVAVSRSSDDAVGLAVVAANIGEQILHPATPYALECAGYSQKPTDALVTALADFQVAEARRTALAQGRLYEAYYSTDDLFVEVIAGAHAPAGWTATVIHPQRGMTEIPTAALSHMERLYS